MKRQVCCSKHKRCDVQSTVGLQSIAAHSMRRPVVPTKYLLIYLPPWLCVKPVIFHSAGRSILWAPALLDFLVFLCTQYRGFIAISNTNNTSILKNYCIHKEKKRFTANFISSWLVHCFWRWHTAYITYIAYHKLTWTSNLKETHFCIGNASGWRISDCE